jgi:MFS family permease
MSDVDERAAEAGPGGSAAPAAAADESLRRNRDFQIVLGGQAVSAFGDAVSFTAMPLLVLALTGSGALMGIVGALQVLPDLVIGLLAGALADRWDRRRMMLWADAGRAVLTAAIPVSYWLGLPTIAVILIVTIPNSILRVLWGAGFTGAVPNLVGRSNLARANSYFEATFSTGFIVGPALAGILVSTIGPASTLAIDAVSFLVSAATLALIRRPLRAERSGVRTHILTEIREGIAFVWGHGALRATIAYWGVMSIATAAIVQALTFYITVDRHFGAELFGFVGSAWSVGYLVGSLVVGRLSGRRVGVHMLVAGGAVGAALLAIAASPLPAIYLLAAFALGVALGIQLVSYITFRALVTPDALLGRVGSTARTISLGLQPIGFLGVGLVVDAAGGGAALAAMGGLAIGASLLFATSSTLRRAGH